MGRIAKFNPLHQVYPNEICSSFMTLHLPCVDILSRHKDPPKFKGGVVGTIPGQLPDPCPKYWRMRLNVHKQSDACEGDNGEDYHPVHDGGELC